MYHMISHTELSAKIVDSFQLLKEVKTIKSSKLAANK